jgi:hypothetical protein
MQFLGSYCLVPNCSSPAFLELLPVTAQFNFRPISVTAVLSRIIENVIVKKFLSPYIFNIAFFDQYVYKPAGFTTCALSDLMRWSTENKLVIYLLQTKEIVILDLILDDISR